MLCVSSFILVVSCFYSTPRAIPSTTLFVQPPSTPPGALQPLRGLTKILRALTFAGHLAHPHQSVEVALCSICDTWKHGSIGHQIRAAELKWCIHQLCNPPLQPPREVRLAMGNKERQAEMETRQEKKKLYGGNYKKQRTLEKLITRKNPRTNYLK